MDNNNSNTDNSNNNNNSTNNNNNNSYNSSIDNSISNINNNNIDNNNNVSSSRKRKQSQPKRLNKKEIQEKTWNDETKKLRSSEDNSSSGSNNNSSIELSINENDLMNIDKEVIIIDDSTGTTTTTSTTSKTNYEDEEDDNNIGVESLPLTNKWNVGKKKKSILGLLVYFEDEFNSSGNNQSTTTGDLDSIKIFIGEVILFSDTIFKKRPIYMYSSDNSNNMNFNIKSFGFLTNTTNKRKIANFKTDCPSVVFNSLILLQSKNFIKLKYLYIKDSNHNSNNNIHQKNNNSSGSLISIQVYLIKESFREYENATSIYSSRIDKSFKSILNYFLKIKEISEDDIEKQHQQQQQQEEEKETQIQQNESIDTATPVEMSKLNGSMDINGDLDKQSMEIDEEENGKESSNDNSNDNNLNSNNIISNNFQFDAKILYDQVKIPSDVKEIDENLFNGQMLSKLKPYQLKTVNWMLNRELNSKINFNSLGSTDINSKFILHPLWDRFIIDGTEFYYNEYTGGLSLDPMILENNNINNDISSSKNNNINSDNSNNKIFGGILADEPGIGKTIELLGLIIVNQKKDKESKVINGPRPINQKEIEEQRMRKLKRDQEIEREKEIAEYKNKDGNIIRCCCGRDEKQHGFGIWVECSNCKKWQFAICVGSRYKASSEFFFCTFCTTVKRDPALDLNNEQDLIDSPDRWDETTLVSSRATLIIVPSAIFSQWQEEIIKHTLGLTVYVYRGIYKDNITPYSLANYDIVLTTYETLSDDSICLDQTSAGKQLRYVKLRAPKSSLKCIEWWRVCIDEAQLVESSSTKYKKLVLSLNAKYRWCLSGTPIQKSLDDMYGLIEFLRVEPFRERYWWSNLILNKYLNQGDTSVIEYFHTILKSIMLRNSKSQVKDEINLPTQYDRDTKLLRFSLVESHYYQKKANECSQEARILFNKYYRNNSTNHISAKDLSKILQPLLVLRQACDHPQVGSSGIKSIQKSMMTMGELLDRLIENATIECKNYQKSLIHAYNCLAASKIIKNDYNGASLLYLDSLNLFQSNSKLFKVDWFQELHVYYNLNFILKENQKILDQNNQQQDNNNQKLEDQKDISINDESQQQLQNINGKNQKELITNETINLITNNNNRDLDKECEKIRNGYLLGKNQQMIQFEKEFKEHHEKVDGLLKEFDKNTTKWKKLPWWERALQDIESYEKKLPSGHTSLIKKIETELFIPKNLPQFQFSIVNKFRDYNGLAYLITSHFNDLFRYRVSFIKTLLPLTKNFSEEHVQESINCPNCRDIHKSRENLSICGHCICLENLGCFREKLFSSFNKKSNTNRTKQTSSIRSMLSDTQLKDIDSFRLDIIGATESVTDSEVERILRLMIPIIKSIDTMETSEELAIEGEQFLKALKNMKRELSTGSELWAASKNYLNSFDEVDSATIRIRLRYPGEILEPHEQLFKLNPIEVDPFIKRFEGEKKKSLEQFKTSHGQLSYLLNLKKSNFSTKSDNSRVNNNNNNNNNAGDGNDNQESICVICQQEFGSNVVMLHCSHTFCYDCVMFMIERVPNCQTITCPICRSRVNIEEISYISTDKENGELVESDSIKGSYGTKIESVVSTLMRIQNIKNKNQKQDGSNNKDDDTGNNKEQQQDNTNSESNINSNVTKSNKTVDKVIIFSQWVDVLEIISRALKENDIEFAKMSNKPNSFEDAINQFRKGNINVLLLPIQRGANGLNLIEATHVFIVEPILNPSVEQQAINRVHRYGQTRETFVHRFLIKNTIEEKVAQMNKKKEKELDWKLASNKNDKDLLSKNDIEFLILD